MWSRQELRGNWRIKNYKPLSSDLENSQNLLSSQIKI